MGRRSKDKRDIYYRLAKSDGWRARSAYKLMQIDEKFKILDGVERVVDLCAAPGSWSQVLAKRLRADDPTSNAKIVAVDLMVMAPIDGVTCICNDITKGETAKEIVSQFEGNLADLVVCDGAPDVSHKSDFDQYVQSHLVLSALNISTHILKPGGIFLAKIFRGKDVNRVYATLKQFFTEVMCVKPKCCRNSSIEAYVLCKNYSPPDDYQPTMQKLLPFKHTSDFLSLSQSTNCIVPFICCGEDSPYDADMCYPVEELQKKTEYRAMTEVVLNEAHRLIAAGCSLHKAAIQIGFYESTLRDGLKKGEVPNLDDFEQLLLQIKRRSWVVTV